MPLSYTAATWVDNSSGNTPITAYGLNRIENALATLAPIPTPDMMCHVYWGSATDPTVIANGITDIPNDTVAYDPYNMRQTDNLSFIVPWAGRYSFYTRVAFTVADSATYSLNWFTITNNTAMCWQGTPPISAATPVSIYSEEILPANFHIKPQVYRATTGAQYIQHLVSGSATRTQSIIRYLGPS